MSKYANYNANLGNRARQLRRDMTRHEKHLWYDFLSAYPAAKWRRQRPIENYIVDFYCASAMLVVELDGSQHYEPEEVEYDRRRTEALSRCGLEVLRFSNADIDRNFTAVCEAIDLKVAVPRLKSSI